jgi:hypothetical protein
MPLKIGTTLVLNDHDLEITNTPIKGTSMINYSNFSNNRLFSSYLSSFFSKRLFCSIFMILAFALLIASCGKMPNSPAPKYEALGAIELHSYIYKNGLGKTLATTFDSLIVEVTAADMTPLRFSKSFNLQNPIHNDTISGIPAGTNRTVIVYTIDRTGTKIHADSLTHEGVLIDPTSASPLNVILIPAMGSIYLQLENIPTKVDSVFAKFTADDKRTWIAQAKRSPKISLSIDKVPSKTHGTLLVTAVDVARNTLYSAAKELTFNATAMENVALNFSSTPGGLAFDITTAAPGVTAVTGSMASSDTTTFESGELLITEIMYAANDSEYVEVFNPGNSALSFDSLYLDIDGTNRLFTNVALPAGSAYVFGRKALPWCDAAHSVASALDLSSTGNWITVRGKDGHMIDRVAFVGGSNTLEWPVVSGKQAIVLDEGISDPALNNFGRNWHVATTPITGAPGQFGTPRSR